MTSEEFWDKIVISEKEKELSEYFLLYRGIAEHENIRIFLQSMQELEDCMKSSREYIVFRQRADDADSGWNAHGRN